MDIYQMDFYQKTSDPWERTFTKWTFAKQTIAKFGKCLLRIVEKQDIYKILGLAQAGP